MKALLVALLLSACGVSAEQHAANVADSVSYAAGLAGCRHKARLAKADGGADAYMATYEACAKSEDLKAGVTEAGQ